MSEENSRRSRGLATAKKSSGICFYWREEFLGSLSQYLPSQRVGERRI